MLKITEKVNYLRKLYRDYRLPYEQRVNLESEVFEKFGLEANRNILISHLNQVLRSSGLNDFDEHEGMYSNHLLVFTALSLGDNKIKNILEIGTYDGKTANILSHLFPKSKITTIDLPDESPVFVDSYGRTDLEIRKVFLEERKNNITRDNVVFMNTNSL